MTKDETIMQIKVMDILDEEYKESVEIILSRSAQMKEVFLNYLPISFWRDITSLSEFSLTFLAFYKQLSFTSNEEVTKLYSLILNKPLPFKWNISAIVFFQKIEEINGRGITHIGKYQAFIQWFKYLDTQIDSYFLKEILPAIAKLDQFKGNVDSLELKRLGNVNWFDKTITAFRKRDNRVRVRQAKDIDLLLSETFKVLEDFSRKIDPHQDFKKRFDQYKDARTEKEFLGVIFRRSLLLPKYKPVDRYVEFFNLLKFLLKDKNLGRCRLADADEFLFLKGIYRLRYRSYQKCQVRTLLGLR